MDEESIAEMRCASASTRIDVAINLRPFIPTACVRLATRYDGVEFEANGDHIVVNAGEAACPPRKQILHTLYREKIYQETLPARIALFNALALP